SSSSSSSADVQCKRVCLGSCCFSCCYYVKKSCLYSHPTIPPKAAEREEEREREGRGRDTRSKVHFSYLIPKFANQIRKMHFGPSWRIESEVVADVHFS